MRRPKPRDFLVIVGLLVKPQQRGAMPYRCPLVDRTPRWKCGKCCRGNVLPKRGSMCAVCGAKVSAVLRKVDWDMYRAAEREWAMAECLGVEPGLCPPSALF